MVRVAPKLMGESRKGERARGKSDPIDALAIARGAQGGPADPARGASRRACPGASSCSITARTWSARAEDEQRLRWHLHDLWPELRLPAGCLDRIVWLAKLARKLAGRASARVRIAHELVGAIRDRTCRASELEREISALVGAQAPELLELPGCGALTAAKLVAETASQRIRPDSKLARLAGVAPIPASSGNRNRHRLDRGGNRQLNCALHRIAVTQGRVHPPAREFLARKQAEGKSRMEALRPSNATSLEPSGTLFAPSATESRSTPLPN